MCKRFFSIIAILFCFALGAAAQEAKGIWAGEIEADDVLAAIRLDFDEARIVLSFAGEERPGAIKNIRVANGEISFTGDLRPEARFAGKINGGEITGTFDRFRSDGTKSGSGIWRARKVDSFEFPDEKKISSTDRKVELPEPTGKFAIGRKFFYWTDESRAETITDEENDKRKLFVQVWYPAKKSKRQTAEYYPNPIAPGDESDSGDTRRAVRTHAVQDAATAASKTRFPVIIFSPGLGSSPFSYAAIIESLVSRGYVVAAINHPYDSGDFKFSDGQAIRFAAEKWDKPVSADWTADARRSFFDERRIGWAKDISFVVDRLEKAESSFGKNLDLQNLGMLGHSFGGQAASIACAADARFKACANLDGMAQGNVVLPGADGKSMKQPFLFFNKAAEVTDKELKIMNLTRGAYRARERKRLSEKWKPSFKKQLAQLESGAYFALYPGIKHSSFSDALLINAEPTDPLYAERFAIAANINDYIAAFFDKFLMKKNAPLLDDPAQSRPPIVLEFLKEKK